MVVFKEMNHEEKTITFHIVYDGDEGSFVDYVIIEDGIPTLKEAVSVSRKYAKYYKIFYPTYESSGVIHLRYIHNKKILLNYV